MFSVSVYAFVSGLGFLWGIVGGSADTAFGELLYEVTLKLLAFNWVVSIIAIIGSFILRKKGKIKASIWLNLGILAYILMMFIVNYFAGQIL